MKRKFFGTLIFLMALAAFAQENDLRSFVGVVREEFSDEQKEFWTSFAEILKKDGNGGSASTIQNYLKSKNFGSGFVYVDSNGKNYVITNKHVVPCAKNATIEFENPENGEKKKYEHLKLVAADEDIDLAIFEFENGENPFKFGLAFSEKSVKDGEEVWAAGFPGFENKPLWQLGKGNITNAKVREKIFLNPEISSVIQHSAIADSGNSGGPLLVSDSSGRTGYKVVGINTWKVRYRQAANYSLPIQLVFSLLEKPNEEILRKNLEKRAESFAKDLNDNKNYFYSVKKYVSNSYANENISERYKKSLRKDREFFWMLRDGGLEGLRYYRAWEIWQKYNTTETDDKDKKDENIESLDEDFDDEDSDEKIPDTNHFEVEEISENAGGFSVKFKDSLGENHLVSAWIYEEGQWRIKSITYTKESKNYGFEKKIPKNKNHSGESKVSVETSFGVSKSKNLWAEDYDGNEIENIPNFWGGFFATDYWLRFFGMGFKYEWQVSEFDTLKLFGWHVGLQVPLSVGEFSLNPFAKAGVQATIFSDDCVGGYYFEGGGEAIFSGFGLGAAAEYSRLYSANRNALNYKNLSGKIYLVFSFSD